jgi:hypothetical protein
VAQQENTGHFQLILRIGFGWGYLSTRWLS